jgi:acyl-CoA synthetase (AMP-forming)/AMP-acid ligase II
MTYPGRPLGDILALTAVHRPEKPATHFLGAELTFLDLKRRSDALAASLAVLGIAKGDRVAIMLPNCPQYIIAAFAILRLGAVVVNINPSYTAREFLVVAADATPRVVIALDALAPLVQGVRDQTTVEHIIVTSLAEYSAAAAAPPRIDGVLTLADLIGDRPGSDPGQTRDRPGTDPYLFSTLPEVPYIDQFQGRLTANIWRNLLTWWILRLTDT